MYSISQPNKHGEPSYDLSSDPRATVQNNHQLTELQLKHCRVLMRLYSEYGITYPITKQLSDTLRCKLWRMGQRMSEVGASKKKKILEEWKTSVWDKPIDSIQTNKELSKQVSSNEKKIEHLF